ncbi:hypothetical protein [Arcicella rosea]|uniref:Acetyltransferase (GNAT) domain-containing protein n=1 Tax=Arcicella rosea TaxID=502909 RepID=A0A841EHB9_9BACT|nr:hypothetical protein [Arcicella rosea]MBB6002782.1 hypothetical protein [Arcicella rosea]
MAYQFISSCNFSFIPTSEFNFTRFFFNEPEHLQQQGGEEVYTFYWKNIENQLLEARFSVIILAGKGFSPLRATFGGIEFSEVLPKESLFRFIELAFNTLLKLESLQITFCPESYFNINQREALDFCFEKLAFKHCTVDQNFEIVITDLSFYETLKSQRHKQLLRKSLKNSFFFREEKEPDLALIHNFITQSRVRKNRKMTMTFVDLRQSVELFPDNFNFFSVSHEQKIIAVGVTVKITDEILYTFYLADDEDYLKYSPTIYLISGIYEYCQRNNFRLLDLGIATEKGILNKGLAQFKQRLGAKQSLKKSFLVQF